MKYLAAFALALVAALIVTDRAKAGDCRSVQQVVVQSAPSDYCAPAAQAQAYVPQQFAIQTYAQPVLVQRQVIVQRQFVQQRAFSGGYGGGFSAQAQFGGRQRAIGGGGGDVIRNLLPVAGAVGGAIVGGPVGAGVGAILGGVLSGR